MAIVVGFSRSVAAQQPNRRTGPHGEVDVIDRERLTVAFGQVLHPDRIHDTGIRVPRPQRQEPTIGYPLRCGYVPRL
jgi:hypothetical protein